MRIDEAITKEEAIKYIRFCMCEGRLVGNTKPIVDEKWQAGIMAIKALEQEDILDKLRSEIVELTKCPYDTKCLGANCPSNTDCMICGDHVLEIIDKYKEGGAE